VTRFAAFEDSALLGRLTRLRRAEADLRHRIETRIRQAHLGGLWVASDPAYQRLAATLRQVRSGLDETEQERLRRAICSGSQETAAKNSPECDDTLKAHRREDKPSPRTRTRSRDALSC
jgi:hypothetical protein